MGITALDAWQGLNVPRVDVAEWSDRTAKAGLAEIKRLRGQLDAAQALFVGIVARQAGRDTRAQLVREMAMSGAEANRAVRVAEVVDRVPGAAEALAAGDATAEHLARLAPVVDPVEAAGLLELAGSCSPDDFGKTVDRFRLDADQLGWRERQRARRFVSFFRGEDGCVGLRGLLPSVEGERVKAAISSICDDAYRQAHPERADTAGGHDVEPRDRRMADALVAAVLGDAGEGGGRTAVIVTVDAETLAADVVSGGPVTLDEVADLVVDARTDLYAMVRNVKGSVLRFGRDRRLATPLQRLAIAARDRGCSIEGCDAAWDRCDVHHEPPYEHGGRTDIELMDLRCSALHHPHRHQHDPPPVTTAGHPPGVLDHPPPNHTAA